MEEEDFLSEVLESMCVLTVWFSAV